MPAELTVLPAPVEETGAVDRLHDIRGSLTVIRGQCYAIDRHCPAPGELIERLRTIDDEVTRIVDAIDGVRDSLEGRPTVGSVQAVDLASLVATVRRRFDGVAGAKSVRVFVQLPSRPVVVTGDVAELQRMLDNLVGNAIRHAPRGSAVRLDVVARSHRVAVRVTDEGSGVRPGRQHGIFERGETSAPSRGWGLGLPIARRIARRHDGDVALEPTVRGALFAVDLPATSRPEAAA